MSVEEELVGFAPEKDTMLTIGVFDGVHLGHQYLISQLRQHARQQNWLSGVVTFRQHPKAVLLSRAELPYLTGLDQKVSFLRKEGVDIVVPLSFTPDLAQLSARQFVGLLKQYLRMSGLLIGPDFVLGRNREGNAAALRLLGQEMNFSVTVIPPFRINSTVVSSTAIREALAAGDMKKVVSLIGRPFSLEGQVINGKGQGSKLGFPTANLAVDPAQALPADGIYATWAYVDDQKYQSMTNIGRRPTFGDNERTVETYILDFSGSLYGRQLKIDIVERLRPEQRFDTVEELKKQITEDVVRGRAILKSSAGK